MTQRVQKTLSCLADYFEGGRWFKDHPQDKTYRFEHSIRVANICREIAAKEGMDTEAAVIAGLLHDLAYGLDTPEGYNWKDHGRDGARLARPFLETLELPEQTINDICYAIAIHVDDKADFEGRRCPFTETVGDADNIDRFDVYRVYESLQYMRFNEMPLSEKQDRVNSIFDKLTRYKDMRLGTETAKKLWIERLDYQLGFYGRLEAQLGRSTCIVEE